MGRWRVVVTFAVVVVLSAAATMSGPADDAGPLHPTMLASDGLLPAHVYHAGPEAVAAYQAAIDHPEVLESVPCLCGCIQALDHASNQACYIESSARGVTVYSSHGLYCVICQRITEDALAGAAKGMSRSQLHAMIEEKYGG